MRHSQDPPGKGEALQLQEFVSQLTVSQGRIRAFIVTLMPGSPDVADVLQETNIVLWNSRQRFQPGTNFLAWAFTIARLEVLHQRSRTKRWDRLRISNELLDMLAAEVPVDTDHECFLSALESCKEKLSPTQQALIEARYTAGDSLEAFADRTGRKASALRVALLRTRAQLRECIEQSTHRRFA